MTNDKGILIKNIYYMLTYAFQILRQSNYDDIAKDYIANGNGGNIELKSLDFEYIQKNFRYSILEIYKSITDDDVILERESWWKELLMT